MKELDSSGPQTSLSEFIGAQPSGCQFIVNGQKASVVSSVQTSSPNSGGLFKSFKEFFRLVFLPEGFPSSVSDDYIPYQIWDTIQAFCSSISGALAARAMFESIGVGDESATAYGATLTWLIKDGTGMVGRIVFAWHEGSMLDSNSKMWRLYADILNDFSFLVDLLTPFAPKVYSIYCISFAGLLRSIVGVAGGATRSALTQHQAKNNNLADVSAKDSSQETLVNLVALICNLFLLSYVKDSKSLIWILFMIFVIGHIFANYRAVKSVVMRTFNRNRYHILLDHFFGSGKVLEPRVVNQSEPVLSNVSRYFKSVDVGCSLAKFTALSTSPKALERFSKEKYLIQFDVKNRRASVLLDVSVDHICLLKAFYQIEIVEHLMNHTESQKFNHLRSLVNKNEMSQLEEETYKLSEKPFQDFLSSAERAGWSLSYVQFSPNQFRYSLGNKKSA